MPHEHAAAAKSPGCDLRELTRYFVRAGTLADRLHKNSPALQVV
jgi:hypothetical protein